MRLSLLLLSLSSLFAQAPVPPAPKLPDGVTADLDVEYSRVGERVAMDIFRPTTTGPHPTVVAIHGGGFRAGTRYGYRALCIKLAQRGYTAATISYRLAPRHQFPAPVEDVKASIRFLRANASKYSVDVNHIGVTGGSAGGHLALMAGLTGPLKIFEGSGPHLDQSSEVHAVVNYYGPSDFTQSYGKSVDAHLVLPMFLGGDLINNRKAHIAASPLNYVTPMAAPTLTVHGTEDTFVNYEQGVWITSKLISSGVDAELETINGAGHGFKGADADRAEARLMAYFDKHLKPAPQTRVLISDHGPKGEVLEILWPSGQELWRVSNARGHDVQSLPNGHVLFSMNPKGKVIEIDEKHQQVWECCQGLEHPLAAQRLPNGNTLIGDARQGRVMEVDKAGKTVWTYSSDDIKNMRMRNSRRTPEGTTLIAVEGDGKLIEVDAAGKIIWQWQAPEKEKRKLYQGRRLPNGNTLISLSDPGQLIEVDRSGKIVRSIGGESNDVRFGWASGTEVLPNGNLLINDYTGRRIVEVDSKGKVVNQLRLGPRTVASMSVVVP